MDNKLSTFIVMFTKTVTINHALIFAHFIATQSHVLIKIKLISDIRVCKPIFQWTICVDSLSFSKHVSYMLPVYSINLSPHLV